MISNTSSWRNFRSRCDLLLTSNSYFNLKLHTKKLQRRLMTSFQSNEMTSYCRTLGGRLNESLVFIVFFYFFSTYVGNGVIYLSTKYVLRLLYFPFLVLNGTFLKKPWFTKNAWDVFGRLNSKVNPIYL